MTLLLLLLALLGLAQAKRLGGLSTTFCVLQNDGQAYCFGENGSGCGGAGHAHRLAQPTQMLNVTHGEDICVGNAYSCVVDQGATKCAGSNSYHELGDGSYASRSVPSEVSGLGEGTTSEVHCGLHSACSILSGTGQLMCWGYSWYGTLGSGSTTTVLVPVKTNLTSRVSRVAVGNHHACVITAATGQVLCFGSNMYGQVGDGTRIQRNSPVSVTGLPHTVEYVSVACGDNHSCAVDSTGRVWCWGEGYYGQLGMGSLIFVLPLPVQALLEGGEVAQSVWAVSDSTFVLLRDGSVRAFGHNSNGVLGNHNTTSMSRPVPFADKLTSIVELRGGYQTTCVLNGQGGVSCLGSNFYQQFGRTSPLSSLVLVQVAGVNAGFAPTASPTRPTRAPTTGSPSHSPTKQPTRRPTHAPTPLPTRSPSQSPTYHPTLPTSQPTKRPSKDFGKSTNAAAAASSAAAALLAVFVFGLI